MNSKKLRRKLLLRRSMGLSATHLSIRRKMPLWIRLLIIFVSLSLTAAVGTWLYNQGANFSGLISPDNHQELERLRIDNQTLTEERDRLTRASITSESSLIIEKATSKQVAEQNSLLEAENAKLKEDLRFFESLLPATGGSDGINVRNLRGQLDIINHQIVVSLLVMQGGKHVNNVSGQVQITATGLVDGHLMTWNYPNNNTNKVDTQLNFSRYQRVELMIPIDPSIKHIIPKSLHVKVISGGAIKTQATGSFSDTFNINQLIN